MKKIIIIVFSIMCGQFLLAQNTTSPYSIIGLGDIEKSSFDRTTALGNSGVALISDKYVLIGNPASLSFLKTDNPFFNSYYIDVATRYKNVAYSGDAVKKTDENISNDLQFKKLTFAIKPKPKWGLSFGILPFSNTSYSFTSTKKIDGSTLTLPATYSGKGSINMLYLSNSFLIHKNVSIGVQTNLLFGNINKREIIYSAITDSVLSTEENIFISKIMFKGGIIYKDSINKNFNFALGATGSLKSTIGAGYTSTVRNGNTVLSSKDEFKDSYTGLPKMFTTGVALNYKHYATFVADYTYQDWSSLKMSGFNYNITNYNKFGLGLQFKSGGKEVNQAAESFYQIGYYTTNGYVNIGGQNITENAITFGAGKQFAKVPLYIQCNVEIGVKGKVDVGLIKENFTQIGLSIGYRDFWNTKRIKRYN